jgi:hypothetical protein
MGDAGLLEPLSLVMKGEKLSAQPEWTGSPVTAR